MDFLDRLLEHDAWTTRQLLERCSELADRDLDRPFDIGHRTVRATLQHIIYNMEAWSALMAGETVLTPSRVSGGPSLSDLRVRLDRASLQLAEIARHVSARGAWDERWLDAMDSPPVEKTYGGAIAHVITHSMHHRAQVLYMLRQLGVSDLPEGDVLSWERQRSGSCLPEE